jgi:F-type H+-transporting ATPase subunit epsilon
MADDSTFHLVVRTPHASVIDRDVHGIRVSTETGQVGLRANREPVVMAIEPGLLLIHEGESTTFASTAGGLVDINGNEITIFTPYAVEGASPEEVMSQLETQMEAPNSELSMRRRLNELEQHILRELSHRSPRPGAWSMEREA